MSTQKHWMQREQLDAQKRFPARFSSNVSRLFSGFRMYNPSYATCGRAKCSTANDGIGTSARQSVATASKQALSAYAAPVGERRKGG